ncbi:hypothetical protein GCM10009616_35610 [Microlunatus lacustris]
MTYSPKAISALYPLFEGRYSSAERSGIAADKSGYHNSRNRLRAVTKWRDDYSIRLPRDLKGDGDAASAFDVKMSTKHLAEVCRRLDKASRARDPRLVKTVREWYGNLDNGGAVDGYSLHLKRAATSDSSHYWHLHISGWRDCANDEDAWLGVAEVCLGLKAGTLTKSPFLPVYLVDPEKVTTNLIGNPPAGKTAVHRKPLFPIETGIRIVGGFLETAAGFRYHLGHLVLESEYKKRPGAVDTDVKPADNPDSPPAAAKPAPTYLPTHYVDPAKVRLAAVDRETEKVARWLDQGHAITKGTGTISINGEQWLVDENGTRYPLDCLTTVNPDAEGKV